MHFFELCDIMETLYFTDNGQNQDGYGENMNKLRYIKDLLSANLFKYVTGIAFLLCVDVLQLILP